MGLREEQKAVGREGIVRMNDLEVSVIIRDPVETSCRGLSD